MAEFKSISLATQVFEKLEQDIITGVYPRGEILTELKLVEQLGVSRTPIPHFYEGCAAINLNFFHNAVNVTI